MKKIYVFLSGLIVCCILCVSCSDNAAESATVPTVTDFYPKDGEVTDQITIEGANFGFNRSDVDGHVYFNGIEAADYISYADNRIVVTVPRGVVTGPITVRRGNLRARTSEKFLLRTDDPLWGMDKGTFEQYFFAEDVVYHTGKSNLVIIYIMLTGVKFVLANRKIMVKVLLTSRMPDMRILNLNILPFGIRNREIWLYSRLIYPLRVDIMLLSKHRRECLILT